ncbi:MAG TPA: SDR family NAD(P)-dependent oxidoreductase [Acidimicrobiales bacterium]|nr:SDR family NAD(P)-dependent oxidoreductase [Acidimicrobiales bacterium]
MGSTDGQTGQAWASQAWAGVTGKQVVITGATRGIGLEAAKALAGMGARVALVARNMARGEAAAAAVDGAGQAQGHPRAAEVLVADLSSQAGVRSLAATVAQRYPAVHVLVNNAGAVFSRRRMTVDGLEMTWALNHVAPWLLTNLLLDKLKASAPARVVTTGSEAGVRSHIPFDDLDAALSWGDRRSMAKGFSRYGQTKLANLVFTQELARRLEGTGVEAFCFHPGLVATGFNKNNGTLAALGMALVRPFARSPERGAQTLVWLASSTQVNGPNGGYFFDRKLHPVPQGARVEGVGRRLWEVTAAQAGL